jgi:hypothetical protein
MFVTYIMSWWLIFWKKRLPTAALQLRRWLKAQITSISDLKVSH